MKSVFQVLQIVLAVHMYVSLVVRIMRNVVDDTGKKNDGKQIGEMEKYFTKMHFLHRTFLKNWLLFHF